jgi:hypothetical protein|tara:strand:- start:12140 stop:14455 length:2316 start_codon:yes stop_codon:yes gene_type:complete
MALTPQQIEDIRQKVERQREQPVQSTPPQTGAINFAETVQPKKKGNRVLGFLGNVGKALIKSERRLGETLGQSAGIVGVGKQQLKRSKQTVARIDRIIEGLKEAEKGTPVYDSLLEQLKIEARGERSQDAVQELKDIAPASKKTGLQIAGEAAGVGIDIVGAGVLGSKAGTVARVAPSGILKGAIGGAKTGFKAGALFGGAHGVAESVQEGETDVRDIAVEGLKQGAIGAAAGVVLGGAVGGLGGHFNRKKEIAQLLKKSPTEQTKGVLKFTTKQTGKITKDKIARQAFSVGIDESDVAVIKSMTPQEKRIAQKMYKISKEAASNKLFSKQAVQEPGKSLVDEVRFVIGQRQMVGKKLGEVVRGMNDDAVDVTRIANDFNDELGNAGIKLGEKGKLNFINSRFANNARAKQLLQGVYDDIRPRKGISTITPQKANVVRQRIFDDLNLGKMKNELTSNDVRILQNVRNQLDEPLIQISDKYRKLATKYARLSGAIERFNKLMGSDFQISDDLAKLRAGEVGRRVLGKASSRPLSMIEEIENIASEFGYKGLPKGSIRKQFIFADFLEDLFGTTQKQSLRGQVAKGVGDFEEASSIVSDLSRGKPLSAATKSVMKGINLARGHTPESQKKAVEGLLGLSDDSVDLISGIVAKGDDTITKQLNIRTPKGLAFRDDFIQQRLKDAAAKVELRITGNIRGEAFRTPEARAISTLKVGNITSPKEFLNTVIKKMKDVDIRIDDELRDMIKATAAELGQRITNFRNTGLNANQLFKKL